jgi:hypothetical protein
METKKAFKKLLNTPELIDKLKMNPTTVRVWKMRYNQKKLSLEKMEFILKRAGFKKIPEQWDLPNAKKRIKTYQTISSNSLLVNQPAC